MRDVSDDNGDGDEDDNGKLVARKEKSNIQIRCWREKKNHQTHTQTAKHRQNGISQKFKWKMVL